MEKTRLPLPPDMARIIRRPSAKTDLLDIWEHIEENSDADRADKFIRKIDKKFQSLANFPRSGRPRDELRPGMRSAPVGRYLILYYPMEDGIKVDRVVYGGRDLGALELGNPYEVGDEDEDE